MNAATVCLIPTMDIEKQMQNTIAPNKIRMSAEMGMNFIFCFSPKAKGALPHGMCGTK